MDQQRGETNKSIPDSTAHDDVWLIAFLRDRDEECPGCSYNLRGLVSRRCPECGQPLTLRVNLAEPYLTAWIVLMTATGLCGGMGCFFVAGVLGAGWPERQQLLIATIWVAWMTMPFVPIVILKRRKFLLLPRRTQWFFAELAIGVLLICMAMTWKGIG